MSKIEKLRRRMLAKPKDFTWDELATVMVSFGYAIERAGGSGRKFTHPERGTLFIHEPHPGRILKAYQLRDAITLLTREGLV